MRVLKTFKRAACPNGSRSPRCSVVNSSFCKGWIRGLGNLIFLVSRGSNSNLFPFYCLKIPFDRQSTHSHWQEAPVVAEETPPRPLGIGRIPKFCSCLSGARVLGGGAWWSASWVLVQDRSIDRCSYGTIDDRKAIYVLNRSMID